MDAVAHCEPAGCTTKRRRRQYPLSSLLLLTLMCAVGLALIVAPAERQRRAVEFVESLNGSVFYAPRNAELHTPEWLRHLLGNHYFRSVRIIGLNHTQVTDLDLAHLKGITGLEVLDLRGTQVSDAGLAHLNGLTALKTLDLEDTQVSDAGLVHLRGLKWLCLKGTRVTDIGLAHLKGMAALEYLDLGHTEVSDGGLVHLKRLTRLTELYLDETRVSDVAVANLQRALPNCAIAHK